MNADSNQIAASGAPGHLASRAGVTGTHSAAIDALFAAFDRPGHAGANIAVIKGGEVIHCRGYGVANIENDVPFSQDTASQIGSTTKHFCAAAILMLEDRGLLSLSDSVRKFVPEMPAFMGAITLRHLLSMTSGLPDGLAFPLFAGLHEGGNLTRAAHLEILTRLSAPMFAPGAGMTYSNSNYLLLSLIVERLGGVPLGEFLKQNLFAPLRMADTVLLADTTSAVPNKATGYVPAAGGRARRASFATELCGDGGIVSTLADMTRWLLHYRSASPLVADFRARLESETRLSDGRSIAYRLGITVTNTHGRRKICHGGGMPGYLCDFAWWPDDDLGVIVLANWMDTSVFENTDRVADIVCGKAVSSTEPVTLPAGPYMNFSRGCAAELKQENGGAVLYLMGDKLPLLRTGPSTLESSKDSAFCPVRVTDQTIDGRPVLEIRCGTVEPLTFEPTEEAAPLAGAQEIAGRYRSPLLQETHVIAFENGELSIRLESALRTLLWTGLKPRGHDVFSATFADEPGATDVTLRFHRDGNGRICRFEYNLFRTRGLVFERLP